MGGLKLGKEAQSKFDEARTSPDKQGTLEKKGAKRKNWNERWFVLKDNYLFYCKDRKSNPQGIINLHGCTVSRIEGPTARPHSFSLLAPKSVSIDAKWTNRTYFMAARDAKEMEAWMGCLDGSGKKAVERAALKKTGSSTEVKEEKEMEVTGKGSSDESSGEEEVKKEEVKKEEVKQEIKKEEVKQETKKESPKKADSDEEKPKKKKSKSKEGGDDGEKKKKKKKKVESSSGSEKEEKKVEEKKVEEKKVEEKHVEEKKVEQKKESESESESD